MKITKTYLALIFILLFNKTSIAHNHNIPSEPDVIIKFETIFGPGGNKTSVFFAPNIKGDIGDNFDYIIQPGLLIEYGENTGTQVKLGINTVGTFSDQLGMATIGADITADASSASIDTSLNLPLTDEGVNIGSIDILTDFSVLPFFEINSVNGEASYIFDQDGNNETGTITYGYDYKPDMTNWFFELNAIGFIEDTDTYSYNTSFNARISGDFLSDPQSPTGGIIDEFTLAFSIDRDNLDNDEFDFSGNVEYDLVEKKYGTSLDVGFSDGSYEGVLEAEIDSEGNNNFRLTTQKVPENNPLKGTIGLFIFIGLFILKKHFFQIVSKNDSYNKVLEKYN